MKAADAVSVGGSEKVGQPGGPDVGAVTPQLENRPAPALRSFLWPTLCLFQLGFASGLITLLVRHAPAQSDRVPADRVPAQAAPHSHEPTEELAPRPAPLQQMARGDTWLRQQRHDLAIIAYESTLSGETIVVPDPLRYRIGLCQEGLGNLDAAAASFLELSGRGRFPWDCAGLLSLGRVQLYLKQPNEAARVLSRLLLRNADPQVQSLINESYFLFGLALACQTLGTGQPTPLNDAAAPLLLKLAPSDRLLELVSQGTDSSERSPQVLGDGLRVEPSPEGVQAARVTGGVGQVPMQQLFGTLADQTGLHCSYSARAAQLLGARTTGVQVAQMPMPLFLIAVAGAHGLACQIGDGELRVTAPDEVPDDAAKFQQLTIAEGVLKWKVVTDSTHPLVPACLLELGSLARWRGDYPEAIGWYERLLHDFPRSELIAPAAYNAAICYRQLDDLAKARDEFYRVVDGSPTHPLAQLAYLRIGRIYLDDGKPELAITSFRRACPQGDDLVRSAAAVGLATAYLLTDNPRAANLSLLEHQEKLAASPYRNITAFLSALARLRSASGRQDNQREARVVLAALLALRGDQLLGPIELLLVGQAYRELAMDQEMVKVYEAALESGVPRWVGADMSFALAEAVAASGHANAGLERLAAVAEQADNAWAPAAQLRLAELALVQQKPDQCLRWGRQAAGSADSQVSRSALKLMGRAYEQLGKHSQAASCYAGQIPD